MRVSNALVQKAKQYALKNALRLDFADPLGGGTDGAVWRSNKNSAVKALLHQSNYRVELRCYQRLQERGIGEILGVQVPVLINHDDELLIVEMEIVSPPFILDFGKAYIDESPPYTPEQLAAWEREWIRLFPKRDLPLVRRVLAKLKGLGIHYLDQKPHNIKLRADDSIFADDEDYHDFEQL